jgi:O-glycosyl hydrolase
MDAMLPLLLLLVALEPPAHPAQTHTDRIDAGIEYQVIENFGASDCWSMQKLGGWSLKNRERVADLLFSREKGAGLSCWRFNIGGGINPKITHSWRTAETFETGEGKYDWSRQAGERWFLQAAKARGVPQFLALVNSPPGRMTRNGLTFADPGGATTNLKDGYEGQFARYLADILQHFRDSGEGIRFNYVSPVNEPQWEWFGHSQEGSRFSNDDIKRVTRALAAELKQRGLATEIALVESGSLPDMWQENARMRQLYHALYGNYLDDLAGDQAFSGLMAGRIGYHDYQSDRLDTQLLQRRQRLAEQMKKYPGWKLWQTEYCVMEGAEGKGGGGRDLTMQTALEVARLIHVDLTVASISAWQWWTAFSPEDYKDGLIYTGWKKAGDEESIYPARLLWALGNYSRFVRPGMRRVELTGQAHDLRGVMGSAYKDEAAKTIVAVYVNAAPEAQRLTLQFETGQRGWKLRDVTPYITSDRDGDELRRAPAMGAVKEYELPARSVVTLVARFR